jgi:hypothetical protein
MQKKILSAVLALCLVGSASVAFAGYYDVDISKSFNDQSDDDGLDLDVNKSLNNMDNDLIDADITGSFNKEANVWASSNTKVDVNAQGNLVKGKFVVQQFGGAAGGAGDVVNVDNSINGSTLNSYNDKNSHNSTYTSNSTYNSNKSINDSYNRTHKSSHKTNIDVNVNVDKSQNFKAVNSFNRNRLGGFGPLPR